MKTVTILFDMVHIVRRADMEKTTLELNFPIETGGLLYINMQLGCLHKKN